MPDPDLSDLKAFIAVTQARKILPTLLSRFLTAHPGITVEIGTNDTFIDILAAGFDAGIRYDERLERDLIAVPIGPRVQHFVAAAAPSYLSARGVPRHPRDLVKHACIGHRFDSGVLATWEFRRGAAIDGLGIVYSFDEFLRTAIERGELVPVLEAWWQSFSGPFLYYPSRTHRPRPLRAFVDFILATKG